MVLAVVFSNDGASQSIVFHQCVVIQHKRLEVCINLHYVQTGLKRKGRAIATEALSKTVEAAANWLTVHHNPVLVRLAPVLRRILIYTRLRRICTAVLDLRTQSSGTADCSVNDSGCRCRTLKLRNLKIRKYRSIQIGQLHQFGQVALVSDGLGTAAVDNNGIDFIVAGLDIEAATIHMPVAWVVNKRYICNSRVGYSCL